MQRTRAHGTTIAWSEVGSGRPLVLLHGLGNTHRTWRLVAPILAKRFRVFMVDLPGHGQSDRPDAPYTLAWYSDTIAAWMDAVGIDRAHLCGHSFGGGVAQWMLLGHRARIDRLALLASGGLGRDAPGALRLAAAPFAGLILESRLFSLITRQAMRWLSRSLHESEALEIEYLARYHALPNSGMAFRRTASACVGLLRGQRSQMWDHIERLKSLPPLALFWGDRDSILPVRHAHATARRLANVTVTVYPRCGHFVQLQAPERFAADAARFLEESPRPQAYLRSEGPARSAPGSPCGTLLGAGT